MDSSEVEIVDFKTQYTKDFKDLNEEWIKTYFNIEAPDSRVLENPQKYILDSGGKILVALYKNNPIGVCALLKVSSGNSEFELAKMAVSPKMRGKGIGLLLGRAIIEKARILGAKSLYLESNTVLRPAISLYKKLGFTEIEKQSTPYQRCNIQMKLVLS